MYNLNMRSMKEEEIQKELKTMVEILSKYLGEDFEIKMRNPKCEISIVMADEDEECCCETPKCKTVEKERLKTPEELTLGERFTLKMADTFNFKEENANIDTVLTHLSKDPILEFVMENKACDAYKNLRNNLNEFINDLITSLFEVDFSKLRKIEK